MRPGRKRMDGNTLSALRSIPLLTILTESAIAWKRDLTYKPRGDAESIRIFVTAKGAQTRELIVTGDLFYDTHDQLCQGRGGISFLMKLTGMSFRRAVYELTLIQRRLDKQSSQVHHGRGEQTSHARGARATTHPWSVKEPQAQQAETRLLPAGSSSSGEDQQSERQLLRAEYLRILESACLPSAIRAQIEERISQIDGARQETSDGQ